MYSVPPRCRTLVAEMCLCGIKSMFVCIRDSSVLFVPFFCGPKVAPKKLIYSLKNENFYYRTFLTSQQHSFSQVKGTVILLREDQDFLHEILLDFTLSTPGNFPMACCWGDHLENMFLIRCCTVWAGSMRRWEELIQSFMGGEHREVSMLTNQQKVLMV